MTIKLFLINISYCCFVYRKCCKALLCSPLNIVYVNGD